MGCGSSNTLNDKECNEVEKLERTNYLKASTLGEKIMGATMGDLLKSPESFMSILADPMAIVERAQKEAAGHSEQEMKDVMLCMAAKQKLCNELKEYTEDGKVIQEISNHSDEESTKTVISSYISFIGAKTLSTVLQLKGNKVTNEDKLNEFKWNLLTLRYCPDVKVESLAVIISESVTLNVSLMRSIGLTLKHAAFLKNVTIAIEDSEGKNRNLKYLAEGVLGSKSIINFCIVALERKDLELDQESFDSLNSLAGKFKGKTLGLCNIGFSEIQKDKIVNSISSNGNINFIGLQFATTTPKAGEHLNTLIKSNIKIVTFGVESREEREKLSKDMKNNSNKKTVMLGFFKN